MKLLRIVSTAEQSTGFFANEFSEPIIVEPDSKIALLNAAVSLSAASIVVDSSNNQIQFRLKANGTIRTATIPVGTYNSTSFLNKLEEVLNFAVVEYGFMWRPSLNEKGILSLNFAKDTLRHLNIPDGNLKNITQASNVYTSTSSNSAFTSFGYTDQRFISSSGFIQAELQDALGDGSNVNGIFGLLKDKPTDSTTALAITDFAFAFLVRSGNPYQYIVNGSVVKTDEEASGASDVLKLEMVGGQVGFLIDEGDGAGYSMRHFQSYTYNSEGYHIGFALRATGAKVSQPKAYFNPFAPQSTISSNIVATTLPLQDVIHQAVSLGVSATPTKVSLILTEKSRLLLGYNLTQYDKTLVSGAFHADISLPDSVVPSSLTVELPNIGLIESYDGLTQKRRNILAVVPSLSKSGSVLTYEPPHPAYIDINNSYKFALSKLEVRILNSRTDEPVNLEDPGVALTLALVSTNSHK